MVDEKLKIGFDLSQWNNQFFVQYLKTILQEDLYTIYIVSSNKTVTAEQITLGTELSSDNIFLVEDELDVLSTIETLKLDVYCSSIEQYQFLAESTIIPIVELNNIQDSFWLQPKWITKLNFWIKFLNR